MDTPGRAKTMPREEKRRVWAEVLLLASVVCLPLWTSLLIDPPYSRYSLLGDALSRVSYALPLCALVLYFMARSNKNWDHFGLGRNSDFYGLISVVGGVLTVGLFSIWLSELLRQAIDPAYVPPPPELLGPVPRSLSDWLLYWPVLMIGAAFEELVFRGFMTTRILDATGNKWIAVLLPAVLFGSYHIYQGIYWMIGAIVYGALLGWMVMTWRRLKAVIIAHFTYNVLVFAGFIGY